jgi:mono/diheme cytochrome c family protein
MTRIRRQTPDARRQLAYGAKRHDITFEGLPVAPGIAASGAGLASGVWRLASLGAVLLLAGCSSIQRDPPLQVWPDMRLQPRFEAQGSTGLFPDNRQSRRRPEGVVARGHMDEDSPFNTGMLENGLYIGKMPIEVTEAVLTEGQRRFNTYCAPCHDQTALGRGMVPQRWPAWQPANLTEQRVVELADGDIFNVITYGRRTMPPYGAPIRPAERWTIIAYLRVLQRAAHGSINDVPEEFRSGLEYKGPPPEAQQPQAPAEGQTKQ